MPRAVFFTHLDPDLAGRLTGRAPADFAVDTHPADLSDADKIPLVCEADFLILFPPRIADPVLREGRRLRLIQLVSAGYEHMNLSLCAELGIPVANNGGANAVDVAEHVLALVLGFYRRLPDLDRRLRQGEWDALDTGRCTWTLHGKRVGLVGLGHIGRQVARLLAPFGCETVYHDLYAASQEDERQLGLTRLSLVDLLASADIVSLHVPLTPQTRGLIGRAELARMRPSALLVNTCRGGVVDEQALLEVLRARRILGAALDVFAREPLPPSSPLLALDNVLLTPHVAGVTADTWTRRGDFVFANLRRVWQGQEPLARIVSA